MHESALLIPMLQAEPLLGPVRADHDSGAAGGDPAHVTLLYPFVPPEEIDEALIRELRAFFAAEPPLAFWLLGPVRFPGDAGLFLALEPAGPTIRLIGRLAARYPDYPRYGRPDLDVIPHVTLADDDAGGWNEIEVSIRPSLPLDVLASEAWLMEAGEDGRWGLRERFPLAGSGV